MGQQGHTYQPGCDTAAPAHTGLSKAVQAPLWRLGLDGSKAGTELEPLAVQGWAPGVPGCLPESLVGLLLGIWALGWPPGLGKDCREMKAGSLERLLDPITAEAVSSWSDGFSWSKDADGEGEVGEEGDGEREAGEGALDDEGEPEAAGNTRGEAGGEAEPAAVEVGELGVCVAGCWAAEDFLQGRKEQKYEGGWLLDRAGPQDTGPPCAHPQAQWQGAWPLPIPSWPRTTRHGHPGPRPALGPKARLVTSWGLQPEAAGGGLAGQPQLHTDPICTFQSLAFCAHLEAPTLTGQVGTTRCPQP